MISTNLSNWTRFPLDESFGVGSVAAYGNGLFVFGETYHFYTSPDGVEITSHHSADATVLAFLNGNFFAFGSSLERSSDGITWSRISMNAYDDMQSVAYGNGVYVAAGRSGMIVRSSDGNNWTQVSDRGSIWFRGLAYGNGHYVAVAGDDTWSSSDGDNWTSVGPLQGYPNAITWANDTFVVVCALGDIHHSRDGVQWTRLAITTNYLSDIIFDGKRFIAVGDGTVLLSTNGTQWITVLLPGTNLNTIAYGEGLYVAGEWISTNAVNWQRIVSPTPAFDITYGNGKFVGVSLNQAIVSDDGRTWRSYEISRQYQNDFVVFAAGTFIAFGSYGRTATSTNGQDWVVHNIWLGSGMAYVNGVLWNAGGDETIRRSGQIEPFLRARKTAAGFELIVQAYPGRLCRLQRATTLGTWTDFQAFTPQTETTTFTDNNPSSQGAFYRVVSP